MRGNHHPTTTMQPALIHLTGKLFANFDLFAKNYQYCNENHVDYATAVVMFINFFR